MATIQSSIQLMDGMSKPLTSIVNAVNLTISALQKVNGTNVKIDTSELIGARGEIVRAGADLKKMEEDIAANIKKSEAAQNRFNNSLRNGVSNVDNLYSKIKRFVGVYAGIQGLKNSLNLSDTLAQNRARLNLMLENYNSSSEKVGKVSNIDNTKTIINNNEKNLTHNISENISSNILNNQINNSLDNTKTVITENQGPNINLSQLQDMIFQSAQTSRGDYLATSDSIGKMGLMAGDAFSSGQEIVGFMELINKQFKIAGTNAAGIDAAMLQLTQAMGSGILRGEEYNSILEQAPIIIQNIAKYLEVPKGKLKDMAAEGKITADVVKNAMFYAATDINEKFEAIPKTFGDAVVNMKNNFIKEFIPISQKLNTFANSEGFTIFTNGVIKSMGAVVDVTVSALDIMGKIGKFVHDNWNVVGPVIGGVTTAVLAYKSALILSNIELVKNNILQGKNTLGAVFLGAKNFYLATSTFMATVATKGLNAALMASPLGIVAGGIALVVGALYAGVAAFNALTGKAVSATGIITGAVSSVVGTILNMGIIIWNTFISIGEVLANAFTHPIYAIKKLFGEFILNIIDMVDGLVPIADKVLGTDMAGKLESWKGKIETNLEVTKPSDYVNPYKFGNPKLDVIDLEKITGKGYNFGASLGENLFKTPDISEDSDIKNYLNNIDKNTASMSEGLDLTTEEIKYMRDAAEMEVINKFTTAEIKMEVQNSNMISNNMDIHDVVDEFTEYLREKMQMTAEGVHT